MNKFFKTVFIFLGLAASLQAKEACRPDLNKEISTLSKQLEVAKADIVQLKKDLEALKTQKSSPSNYCAGKTDALRRDIADCKELEQVLVKFGNNPEGMSSLHYAIKVGDANAVSLLLANGADPNSLDMSRSYTALIRAAICNQYEIAEILINLGADVNYVHPDQGNYYPIHYAAEFSSGALIKLLIANGAMLDRVRRVPSEQSYRLRTELTPLNTAAKAGNYEAVIALVNAGAKIDGNQDSETPLESAAQKLHYKDNPQNLDLIKFLVEKGATRKNRHANVPCEVIGGYLKSVSR